MRTFEIILLLLVTILPFVKRPLLKRVNPNDILIGLGVLLSLHLIIEGWRWQMIPAYILVLLLAWRIKAVDIGKAPAVFCIVLPDLGRGVGCIGHHFVSCRPRQCAASWC